MTRYDRLIHDSKVDFGAVERVNWFYQKPDWFTLEKSG